MKGLVTVFMILVVGFSFAQRNQLKAYIEAKNYFSPNGGTYIELHYQFVATSIKFEPAERDLVARLIIKTTIVDRLTQDTVVKDGYILQSPRMRDSIIEDFYDIVRFPLKSGNYFVSVDITDDIAKDKNISGVLEVELRPLQTGIQFSDITIAEVATPTETVTNMYKSGYEILPRLSNFYGENMTSIPYYIELYHSKQLPDTLFGYKQQIIDTKTNEPVAGFSRFTKMTPAEVVPVFRNVDIAKLPSGSYRLKIEAVDRNNNPLCNPSEYYFERVNDLQEVIDITKIILDPSFQASVTDDSLKFYLSSLIPIARPAEARSIIATLKTKNVENYRKHLQQFWTVTAGSNAATEWLKYKQTVLLVQTLFGSRLFDGFETDRGRVFLQYGAPNNVLTKESSPSEYPYEIWTYNKIKNFSNKRFIFYNPDLVTENYRLLHSDMVGEVQNYKWPMMLVKRNTSDTNTEDTHGTDHYGGNGNYNYNSTSPR